MRALELENQCAAIMQPGYFPWLGFFELMNRSDIFVFLDDVQYTRRDWRNRNRIRCRDGWQWLTVPVFSKGKRSQYIMDVKIKDGSIWAKKHCSAFKINYQKSEFFDYYYPDVEKILFKDWVNLADLCIETILFLKNAFGITTPCIRSSSLNIKSKKNNRIFDICRKLKAGKIYDSKAAKNFLETDRFLQGHIAVEFQDYIHPEYKQVYAPFIPYMSALDLLFNHGENSLNVILKASKT